MNGKIGNLIRTLHKMIAVYRQVSFKTTVTFPKKSRKLKSRKLNTKVPILNSVFPGGLLLMQQKRKAMYYFWYTHSDRSAEVLLHKHFSS